MQKQTDLSKYDNSWYKPGKNAFVRLLWYFTNIALFKSGFPINSIKISMLRMFGARIGKGVVLKPHVSVKYPWRLSIGNYVWIGENAWIDNLDDVSIDDNVCISQGALLLCGNHHYKKTTFDLITAPIHIKQGAWIGAKSIVCPGIIVGSHAVLAVGSVATNHLNEYTVYQGNPAQPIKKREIE